MTRTLIAALLLSACAAPDLRCAVRPTCDPRRERCTCAPAGLHEGNGPRAVTPPAPVDPVDPEEPVDPEDPDDGTDDPDDDGNNGHGNDPDGDDDSNPGKEPNRLTDPEAHAAWREAMGLNKGKRK